MQAKTVAGGLWELVENHLATKEDLADMEARLMAAIDRSAVELRREAADAKYELLEKISSIREELIERLARVEAKIDINVANLKSELIMWGVILLFGKLAPSP